MKKFLLLFFLFLCCSNVAYAQDAPDLPPGLSEGDMPDLPEGLTEETPAPADDSLQIHPKSFIQVDLTGFLEIRSGMRIRHDAYEKSTPVGEGRLHAELEKHWINAGFKISSDYVYDTVVGRNRIQLDEGEGWLDMREASLVFTPADFMDVKTGRQIMTWGTGDLVFINDLFPKDWVSFFIGRDVEYLKAPSDTVRISLFSWIANIDFYYSPSFNSDRYITGRRISYWNTMLHKRSGRDHIVRVMRPEQWFADSELGLRIFKNIRGYELATYGYRGFWKSPSGMDVRRGKATFPDLNVYGASIRGNVFSGIGNMEFGYYDSGNDRSGKDPSVRNSEVRLLAGYEIEIARDFTIGFQYYMEKIRHYHGYKKSFQGDNPPRKHYRNVFTMRITRLLMGQNIKLSLFAYICPSDSDYYIRPNMSYKLTDLWTVEAGGNVFYGRHDYSFFGQFEKNSNLYFSIRRYFHF